MTARFQIQVPKSFAFKSTEDRVEMAKYVATTIDRGPKDGLPRKLNDPNDHEFQLDEGNDWIIIFDREDNTVFWLQYRYAALDAVEALMKWLAFRLGATLKTHIG